jgi:DNA polymerase III delta prime subunit
MTTFKLWDTFYNSFEEYIDLLPAYKLIYLQLVNNDIETSSNILTYGVPGFPHILLIEYFISKMFSTTFPITKRYHLWNDMPYTETDYYFEIDMAHPEFPKDIELIIAFLLSIIKNKCIYLSRHIFILKNIDVIHNNNSQAFRVILERFSGNVLFIATTNKLNMIERPILSRMTMFRIPIPTEKEQKSVLYKLTNKKTIRYIDQNLVKNIFFNETIIMSQIKTLPKLLYPPIQEFIDRVYDKEEVRKFSYKLYQHTISIQDIVKDLLHFIEDDTTKIKFIQQVADIEYMSCKTDSSKVCFFIESVLHTYIDLKTS